MAARTVCGLRAWLLICLVALPGMALGQDDLGQQVDQLCRLFEPNEGLPHTYFLLHCQLATRGRPIIPRLIRRYQSIRAWPDLGNAHPLANVEQMIRYGKSVPSAHLSALEGLIATIAGWPYLNTNRYPPALRDAQAAQWKLWLRTPRLDYYALRLKFSKDTWTSLLRTTMDGSPHWIRQGTLLTLSSTYGIRLSRADLREILRKTRTQVELWNLVVDKKRWGYLPLEPGSMRLDAARVLAGQLPANTREPVLDLCRDKDLTTRMVGIRLLAGMRHQELLQDCLAVGDLDLRGHAFRVHGRQGDRFIRPGAWWLLFQELAEQKRFETLRSLCRRMLMRLPVKGRPSRSEILARYWKLLPEMSRTGDVRQRQPDHWTFEKRFESRLAPFERLIREHTGYAMSYRTDISQGEGEIFDRLRDSLLATMDERGVERVIGYYRRDRVKPGPDDKRIEYYWRHLLTSTTPANGRAAVEKVKALCRQMLLAPVCAADRKYWRPALEYLGRYAEPADAPALMRVLADEKRPLDQRTPVLDADDEREVLIRHSSKPLTRLIRTARPPELWASVLHDIVQQATWTGDRWPVDLLLELLEHDDPRRRKAAARLLSMLSGAKPVVDPRVWRTWWNQWRPLWDA